MKYLIVLVLLIGLSLAVTVPHGACPGERDNLLECFDQLIDTDHDGNITVAELDTMLGESCLSHINTEYHNSTFIMNACDTDANNMLNAADWNHADACLAQPEFIDFVCRACYVCGFEPAKKK